MDIIKLAYDKGIRDCLNDLGIIKQAAEPIYDNPYEDAPDANVKKVLGKSISDFDDMFARINSMPKSRPAMNFSLDDYNLGGGPNPYAKKPAAKKPAAKSRPAMNFSLDDYNLGEGPNPYAKKPAKSGPVVTPGKPRVTPIPGTGNEAKGQDRQLAKETKSTETFSGSTPKKSKG